MANEPDTDAVAAQDPRQLVIDPARDPDTVKGTVYGLHPIKRPVVAFVNKFGPGGRRGGDERREGGQLRVSLLRFGSGK